MGSLYVVATPIGNLEDVSLRAIRILKEADAVLGEDTRVAKKLLDRYGIKTPVISYHQHSGNLKTDRLLGLLREGKSLALVTDAGTPGISDPGSRLVSLVREKLPEVSIVAIPGPSALAAALSLAGDGLDRFLFLGFLPHKKGRQTMLREVVASPWPTVLYESKHRILKLLEELTGLEEKSFVFELVVARELTKIHESLYLGRPEKIAAELQANPLSLKGEFVVLIKKKGAV